MRKPSVRVVEFGSDRPERERDFDEEERRDHDRNHGKHLQPGWGFDAPRCVTFGGQKGIGEVNQDAYGVYDDLRGCGVNGETNGTGAGKDGRE